MGAALDSVLMDLGFSANEARVYQAVLELGSAPVVKIAKQAQLHRTNVYDCLEKLVRKGLVAYATLDKTKQYSVTNPQALLSFIKDKEAVVEALLPQLTIGLASESTVRIVEGVRPFMDILHALLAYNQPIFSWGIPRHAYETLKIRIPHFHTERIKKKIQMNHIYNHDMAWRATALNSMRFTEARISNEGLDAAASTNICGEDVVLTVWADSPISIHIHNKTIADAYRASFAALWKLAKKPSGNR